MQVNNSLISMNTTEKQAKKERNDECCIHRIASVFFGFLFDYFLQSEFVCSVLVSMCVACVLWWTTEIQLMLNLQFFLLSFNCSVS